MGDNTKTVYITMIRDPVDIFVSAWDYYKMGGSYKMTIGKNRSSSDDKVSVLHPERHLFFLNAHCRVKWCSFVNCIHIIADQTC